MKICLPIINAPESIRDKLEHSIKSLEYQPESTNDTPKLRTSRTLTSLKTMLDKKVSLLEELHFLRRRPPHFLLGLQLFYPLPITDPAHIAFPDNLNLAPDPLL